MFDTMTLTKITGAFCGALLIYLLGGWAAETIYHMGGGHGGHGEEGRSGASKGFRCIAFHNAVFHEERPAKHRDAAPI